jgi:serine/threonine-protein kinase
MAVVYAAEHRTLGHRTACKVLRPEFMRQEDAVARFLLEAQKISTIRHPNLIDIFDSGELADGRLYYVMEYLAGRPLSQVAAQSRLPFAEIIHIGRQVCAGLSAAHAAELVHRDLSPDNLFLCERPGAAPLVKIMDFGVAEVTRESRRAGGRASGAFWEGLRARAYGYGPLALRPVMYARQPTAPTP